MTPQEKAKLTRAASKEREKQRNKKERLAWLFQERQSLQGALVAARATANTLRRLIITRACGGLTENDQEIHSYELDGRWASRLDYLITDELRSYLQKIEAEIDELLHNE